MCTDLGNREKSGTYPGEAACPRRRAARHCPEDARDTVYRSGPRVACLLRASVHLAEPQRRSERQPRNRRLGERGRAAGDGRAAAEGHRRSVPLGIFDHGHRCVRICARGRVSCYQLDQVEGSSLLIVSWEYSVRSFPIISSLSWAARSHIISVKVASPYHNLAEYLRPIPEVHSPTFP